MICCNANNGNRFIDTGEVRYVAGLGVTITEVYTSGRCYLKDFFNAIEAWRVGRNIDGWKLSDAMLVTAAMDMKELPAVEFKKGYPASTWIMSKLLAHVDALLCLFSSETP